MPHRILRLKALRLARLGLCCLLASAWLLSSPPAFASGDSTAVPLPQIVPASQMTPADTALIHAKQRQIEQAAAFRGYHLNVSHWTWSEVRCPLIPNYLMLRYRSRLPSGAEWLFTALVPRHEGNVLIVPVLYRSATPYGPAAQAKNTIAVFNRVVPAAMAAQSAKPDGPWLPLAVCYAVIAGAAPHVLTQANSTPARIDAPVPSLRMSEGRSERQVVFADPVSSGGYTVWSIHLTGKGRVTAARAKSFSNSREQVISPSAPKEIPLSQRQPKAMPNNTK